MRTRCVKKASLLLNVSDLSFVHQKLVVIAMIEVGFLDAMRMIKILGWKGPNGSIYSPRPGDQG